MIRMCLGLLVSLSAVVWAAGPASVPSTQPVTLDPATVVGKAGFFRVGKSTQGQWWLIGPDDKPFYYRGVTSINRAGTQGGRLAQPGAYAAVVDAKYGWEKDKTPFANATMERLKSWNFNALGAWATEEFFDRGMPYTEILEFSKLGGPNLADPIMPDAEVHGGSPRVMPDVFDPAWAARCDKWAATYCPPRKNSRELVGYFTDNEIGLGANLLEKSLATPGNRPARKAAVDFLLKRHGTLARTATAWGVAAGTADELAQTASGATTPAFTQDQAAFLKLFAEQYFRVVAEAIRKHDPNHLILGCRFGGPPPLAVLEACRGPWVDVVSANNYQDGFYERMDIYFRGSGKPVLGGEFNWRTGYFEDLPWPFEPKGGRIEYKAKLAMGRLFTHPGVVGYTYYRWVHGTDGQGLINRENDEAFPNVTRLVTEMNAKAEPLRLSHVQASPLPADGRFILLVPDRRAAIGLVRQKGQWLAATPEPCPGTVKSIVNRPLEQELSLSVVVSSGPTRRLPEGRKETVEFRVKLKASPAGMEGEAKATSTGRETTGMAYLFEVAL